MFKFTDVPQPNVQTFWNPLELFSIFPIRTASKWLGGFLNTFLVLYGIPSGTSLANGNRLIGFLDYLCGVYPIGLMLENAYRKINSFFNKAIGGGSSIAKFFAVVWGIAALLFYRLPKFFIAKAYFVAKFFVVASLALVFSITVLPCMLLGRRLFKGKNSKTRSNAQYRHLREDKSPLNLDELQKLNELEITNVINDSDQGEVRVVTQPLKEHPLSILKEFTMKLIFRKSVESNNPMNSILNLIGWLSIRGIDENNVNHDSKVLLTSSNNARVLKKLLEINYNNITTKFFDAESAQTASPQCEPANRPFSNYFNPPRDVFFQVSTPFVETDATLKLVNTILQHAENPEPAKILLAKYLVMTNNAQKHGNSISFQLSEASKKNFQASIPGLTASDVETAYAQLCADYS